MLLQLKTAVLPKSCAVYVMAGVQPDTNCLKYKRKPVQDLRARQRMVQQCRFVDEVIPDIEWTTSPEFLTKYKIDFVSHDSEPYLPGSGADGDVYGWLKKANLFIETKRTRDISTTELRNSVKSSGDSDGPNHTHN